MEANSVQEAEQRARGGVFSALLAAPLPALVPALLLACGGADGPEAAARDAGPEDAGPAVRPGIEVLLADSAHLVAGKRVGLVTNQTGVGRDGTSSIDLLFRAEGTDLVALFSPEHGIRGIVEAGEAVEGEVDEATGLSVHSLYGETRKPTPGMLEGLDLLLFDLQDIGARYYTYVSTMALAMEAAGEARIPFVVLDRPNPLGGKVQGNVLDPAHATFVGMFPVPMRHGMTPGELARLYVAEFGLEAELRVIPADGWTRRQWFDETGLPWVRPSPSMPSVESAAHYPGTCLFEGTNLSAGRGTEHPFQQVGAPWMDGERLAERLAAYRLPGVRFEAVTFTPSEPADEKYGGETVRGVRLVVTDRETYDPTVAGVALLLETRRMAGDRWEWREAHFDRLAGNDRLRARVEALRPLEEVVAEWPEETEAFRALRRPHLLYP